LVRNLGQSRAFPRQSLPEGPGRSDGLSFSVRRRREATKSTRLLCCALNTPHPLPLTLHAQMTVREGSLEAPTRHPIDWQAADFYDEDKAYAEMHRIFDICHGCRRCVNLCTAFPTLFDLIDEGKTGELDGVDRKDFAKVVDQCYLCDLCYMTKCPYVPPHPWNVDFPHVMLRAKAIHFKQGQTKFRDRLLTSTDAVGKLAAIPVVAQTVNAVNRNGAARGVMEKVLGVHKDRELPPYAPSRFRSSAKPGAVSKGAQVKNGERTPGKVAIFATCYVNYNE